MAYASWIEYFWSHVRQDPDGCWVWTAFLDKDGYGSFSSRRGMKGGAHRIAFVLAGNELPKGVPLDHLCRNRACVRPSHLEVTTPKINNGRGTKAQQTECIHGHEFTEANTYRKPNGTRSCRTCHREREVGYRARQRERA